MAKAKAATTTATDTSTLVGQRLFQFALKFEPLEEKPFILTDKCTDARFCECHVKASKLVEFGTTNVPLDPEEQADYRANRNLVVIAPAFEKMRADAREGRSFSNIVAEYNTDFDEEHPLKIIGGQHRFTAMEEALSEGVDEWHGVKVYFCLDKEQRLDVQLISNTSIAISGDLFDRMHETARGPELRDWCQEVGFLKEGEDFTDRRRRGGAISVQIARTFIMNFYAGQQVDPENFATTATVPVVAPAGRASEAWEKLLNTRPKLYSDPALKRAAKEFVRLISAQRAAFAGQKVKPDYPEKALNLALLAAWAYVAGMLRKNDTRLKRLFALADKSGAGDPLNAHALAEGRHKTDADNYRGLGYRTDAKERGRFTELFFLIAEKGSGVSLPQIKIAIGKFFAKEATLDVQQLEAQEADE